MFFLATQKKNFTVLLPDILVSLKNYCNNFRKMTSKTIPFFLDQGINQKDFPAFEQTVAKNYTVLLKSGWTLFTIVEKNKLWKSFMHEKLFKASKETFEGLRKA